MNEYDTNMLASVRDVARFHGWAIGLHGSTKRDLDMIAVPWTENAAPFRHLLTALKEATGYERMDRDTAGPDKPHGRYAVLLKHPAAQVCKRTTKNGKTGWAPKVLDISFVDRRITTDAAEQSNLPPLPRHPSLPRLAGGGVRVAACQMAAGELVETTVPAQAATAGRVRDRALGYKVLG